MHRANKSTVIEMNPTWHAPKIDFRKLSFLTTMAIQQLYNIPLTKQNARTEFVKVLDQSIIVQNFKVYQYVVQLYFGPVIEESTEGRKRTSLLLKHYLIPSSKAHTVPQLLFWTDYIENENQGTLAIQQFIEKITICRDCQAACIGTLVSDGRKSKNEAYCSRCGSNCIGQNINKLPKEEDDEDDVDLDSD